MVVVVVVILLLLLLLLRGLFAADGLLFLNHHGPWIDGYVNGNGW